MAKKQTRRTVSLSRATYDAATEAAARAGVATSEWVTNLIRAACPELQPQRHASAQPATPEWTMDTFRAAIDAKRGVTVRKMTDEARQLPPRADLDALAAKRKLTARHDGIAPGTLCAICVEDPATHREQIDADGPLYAICDGCAQESPRSGRYSFSGGRGDRVLGASGDGNKHVGARSTGSRR